MKHFGKVARMGVGGLLLAAMQAQAGWTCSGRVTELTLDPSGNVYLSLQKPDNSYVWNYKPICNLQTANNNVQPQACKSIYATLVTSVALNRTVTFWFDYPNASSADCSPTRFAPWAWLATDGTSPWYFGPRLD